VIVDFGLAEIDENFVKKLRDKVKELQENCHELYEEYRENMGIYDNIQQCLNAIGRNKIGT
jgi:septation ring formation regulator EzrA